MSTPSHVNSTPAPIYIRSENDDGNSPLYVGPIRWCSSNRENTLPLNTEAVGLGPHSAANDGNTLPPYPGATGMCSGMPSYHGNAPPFTHTEINYLRPSGVPTFSPNGNTLPFHGEATNSTDSSPYSNNEDAGCIYREGAKYIDDHMPSHYVNTSSLYAGATDLPATSNYDINGAGCICQNIGDIYSKGLNLYYDDNIDEALSHFQQYLNVVPNDKWAMHMQERAKLLKEKREKASDAYKLCFYQKACDIYSEALTIDPINRMANANLYFSKAMVLYKLGKLRDSVDDYTAGLNLNESYLPALLERAKCYMVLEEYEEAVRDYEKVCELKNTMFNKKLLQDAKRALEKFKHKDCYGILGVDRNASEGEIKRAYRKRARVHHPDKHSDAPDAEKNKQEKKFKELGEAYRILSDPEKKAKYDQNQGMDEYTMFEEMSNKMSDLDVSGTYPPSCNCKDCRANFGYTEAGGMRYGKSNFSDPGGFQ